MVNKKEISQDVEKKLLKRIDMLEKKLESFEKKDSKKKTASPFKGTVNIWSWADFFHEYGLLFFDFSAKYQNLYHGENCRFVVC